MCRDEYIVRTISMKVCHWQVSDSQNLTWHVDENLCWISPSVCCKVIIFCFCCCFCFAMKIFLEKGYPPSVVRSPVVASLAAVFGKVNSSFAIEHWITDGWPGNGRFEAIIMISHLKSTNIMMIYGLKYMIHRWLTSDNDDDIITFGNIYQFVTYQTWFHWWLWW